jgi:hypothetical protein
LVEVAGAAAVRPGVQAAGGGCDPLPAPGQSGNDKAALWPPFFSETGTYAPFPLLLARHGRQRIYRRTMDLGLHEPEEAPPLSYELIGNSCGGEVEWQSHSNPSR